ncbi:hypothetical protein [Microbacterium stercoris]|uniref:Uncharacterized protein n=1 Tax=Microbacterium stercoris TaxID=2820289 RepID=A0A939TSD7_9MICO|nr:hypothetical protein [Microbacterium stercoris]MBO3665086.1 hypothetical protein [Microbacterium stercoris]
MSEPQNPPHVPDPQRPPVPPLPPLPPLPPQAQAQGQPPAQPQAPGQQPAQAPGQYPAYNPYAPQAPAPGQPPAYGAQPAGQPPAYGAQPAGYGAYPSYGQPPVPPPYPGYAGAGYVPAPPQVKKRSPWLIIGLVGAGVVVLAIIGMLIAIFSSPAAAPADPEIPDPPVSQPSDPDAPVADAVAFGDCAIQPADGWALGSTGEGSVMLQNASGELLEGTCAQLEAGVEPGVVVQSWFDFLAERDCTASEMVNPPAAQDAGVRDLDVGMGMMLCTVSTAQGTIDLGVLTISATRDDGLTGLTTLYFAEGSDFDTLNAQFATMTQSVWMSVLED